jgi:hypothetical protein
MNQNIYQAALVLHVAGITMMGGATVVDYLAFRKFWASLMHARTRAITLLEVGTTCQRIMGIGMLLIIISGVAMMAIMHGVWGEQIWFRVKFGLLLLIILNGLGIRRILASRLSRQVHDISPEVDVTNMFSKLQMGLSLVHAVQFILFIGVFVLSIFKFN